MSGIRLMRALFDVLTDNCQNNKFLSEESILYRSIQNHLTILLNTRQGSLHHLPNYGLPDLNLVYQGLPISLNSFAQLLSQIIEQYEPRLIHVKVCHKQSMQVDCVIYFEIHAQIRQGAIISFDTYFLTGGKAVIQTDEKYN